MYVLYKRNHLKNHLFYMEYKYLNQAFANYYYNNNINCKFVIY